MSRRPEIVKRTSGGRATGKWGRDSNDHGVLDHRVSLAGKPEIYVPLRMLARADDTEVILTLFRQPDMDDAAFERDAGRIVADLKALKRVLESQA